MKQENEKQEEVAATMEVIKLTKLINIRCGLEHELCLLTQALLDNNVEVIRVLMQEGMEEYLKVDYPKINSLIFN